MNPNRALVSAIAAAALVAAASAQEDPAASQGITWADLLGAGSKMKLYGFLRLDTMYDDSRMNDPQIPIWVKSEDPAVAPPIGAGEDDSEFSMSARLTRLGLDLDGPPVDEMGGCQLGGKIEVDFYNIGLDDSDSRNAIRMRLAYLDLDWGRWGLLAGQDWDVFSPLYPIVNNDIVMWGAGNTGDRRPQVTARYQAPSGENEILTEFGFAFPGAVGGSTVEGGLRSGEASGQPMWNARIGYHGKTAESSYQVGVWGATGQAELDVPIDGETTFDATIVGLDARIPLHSDRAWITTEYWLGENMSDYRGGILQGVNPTSGEEIAGSGGFLELGLQATSSFALYAGYSRDDPDNADLDPLQRADNSIPYLAARWRFGDVRFGFEYLNWTTEYIDAGDGTADRVAAWIAYYF